MEAAEVAAVNSVCFWLPFNGEQAGESGGASAVLATNETVEAAADPLTPSLPTLLHL